jgi:hypothetical protein
MIFGACVGKIESIIKPTQSVLKNKKNNNELNDEKKELKINFQN